MKSRESNVDYLFSRTNLYRVPLYQRHYVWNEKNWGDLWTDIKDKSNMRLKIGKSVKTHFTGAIVIQPDAGKLEIIDGQQRLTTFQIILCAIRDVCKVFDNDTANIEKTAQDRVLNDLTRFSRPSRSPEDDQRYKLLPRAGSDQQTFRYLVASKVAKAKKTDKSGFIYGAYVYFKDEIQTYVTQHHHKLEIVLDTLIETILKDFVVIQITADSDDDPEKIFQTINGTGQALNDFDLLRNDLFLRAGTGTKREDLYKQHWQQFDEYEFWRRKNSKMVDEFLRDFLKTKRGADFRRGGLFDQYQVYCKRLEKKAHFIKHENLVEYEFEELSRYADVYRKMHDPNSDYIGQRMEFYKKFNKDFQLTLQLLKSFVLYIINELGLSSSEHKLVFDLLESYAVRCMLGNRSAVPAAKINSLFLDILTGQKGFYLLDLWHLLSNEFPGDEEVNSMIAHLLPYSDKHPKESSSKEKRKNKLLQKLGSYISYQIKSPLSNLELDELRKRFCEIWPSSEVLLQSCFKDKLPIFFSQLPASVKVRHLSEPYMFVTYNGIKKLSKYEVQQGKMVGIDEDSDSKKEIGLPLEEILFAFPATARSRLQPILNDIQDDIKNQKLIPISKQEALQIKNLPLLDTGKKISDSNHWLPQNTGTWVGITRAGHVLSGRPKIFNDDVIYMEINEQIITVYIHGLCELKKRGERRRKTIGLARKMPLPWQSMIEAKKNQPIRFIYNDGIIELSQIVKSQSDITGFDNIKGITRQLSLEEILFFAYSAKTPSNDADLKFWTDMDPPKSAQPSSHCQELQVVNSTIDFKSVLHPQNRKSILKVVTRAGHILQGNVKIHDKEAIYMQIKQHSVVVFKHALLEAHLITFGDLMLESEPFKFTTYEKSIELSQIETGPYELTGIDKSGEQLPPLKKLNILFAYPIKAAPNVEPIKIDDQVKDQTLGPSQKDRFQIETSHLESAMAEKISIRILTRRGHVLEGTIEHYDKYEIHLQIKGQTVIVYKHGLYEISTEAEDIVSNYGNLDAFIAYLKKQVND